MLIFVLQTIWLYIKELAGKDLDIPTVLKFLAYFSPKLIPLVLPLTILLASIMVFGNFAENYEFAAMKSTGISLQRAMVSLSIFIVLLGIVTFIFSNTIIPWGEYNSYNLRRNIAKLKPAMVIAEGQFNDVGNLNIKVEKKSGDKGQYLDNVVIHKKTAKNTGNYTTIIADHGELISAENSDILQLVLFDGNYYDDTPPKKAKDKQKRPFAKSTFKKYTINADLSKLNNIDLEEKNVSNKYSMLNLSELDYTIDSLTVKRTKDYTKFSKNLYARSNIASINTDLTPDKDSIFTGNILDLFNTKKKLQLVEASLNTVKSTNQIVTSKEKALVDKNIWLNKHIMAYHDKLALGFACIILFFVGAPLGALIRKGGIGLPMVIAILLFLTYHFIGIFAKNSAKDGSFNPVLASWFSTIIMLPLGVYLTNRATKDRQLFEVEILLKPLKKFFGIKSKDAKIEVFNIEEHTTLLEELKPLENDKLIDYVKNFRQYGYNKNYKNAALHVLENRGITKQQLVARGKIEHTNIDEVIRLKNLYNENSKLALFTNIGLLLFLIPGLILRNNKLETVGTYLIIASIVIGVIYLFSFFKSYQDNVDFNKLINRNTFINHLLYFLPGLPLFFIYYFIERRNIKKIIANL